MFQKILDVKLSDEMQCPVNIQYTTVSYRIFSKKSVNKLSNTVYKLCVVL